MRAFFFGCWNEPGHFLHLPGGRCVYSEDISVHRGIHLDGNYAPRTHHDDKRLCWGAQHPQHEDRRSLAYRSEEQAQGRFLRHQRGGFTLIQWWDRAQGDKRGACNSTFLLEGDHDTPTMLAKLRELFPHVVANLERAGIELVEVVP